MSGEHRHRGFSLTEVLLAVGTLAVAMLFIAGTFLVAVHFAMVTTERTTAALAADEAFAKIRLYGVNPGSLQVDRMVRFAVDPNESAYPSTDVEAVLLVCPLQAGAGSEQIP